MPTLKHYSEHPAGIFAMARLSQAAYECAHFRDVETDTEAMTILGGLSVRGTEADLRDIREDLRVGMRCRDDAYIHAGFLESAEVLLPFAQHYVKVWGSPIDLTGHSLGGAVATVLAFLMPVGDVRSLTTFGAPRAGDAAFCAEVARRCPSIVRVTNAADVVSTVPWAVTGYQHLGHRLYLTEEGHWWNPTIWERAWMRLFSGHTPLGAHSIKTYCDRLQKFGF